MNRTGLTIKMLTLLKARGKMSTKELAEELETNPRNIREFRKELELAGYVVEETRGRYGGYRLLDTGLFPVTVMEDNERKALVESREIVKSHQDFERLDQFNSALDKVLNSTKSWDETSRYYLSGESSALTARERDLIAQVEGAIRDRQSVLLYYQSVRADKPEPVLIDPYEIVHFSRAYYVLGFSHLRNDYRIYRFSEKRMFRIEVQDRHFLRDSHFQIRSFIGNNSLIKGDFYNVKLAVDLDMTRLFEESYWGVDMRLEYETEKEAVYNFLVEDRYEFFRQVFSFDGSCEILEPQSLRDEYIERIKKCQERYKI